MSKKQKEQLLMEFLDHYEQHREGYKENWTPEQVVKTFVKNWHYTERQQPK